MNSRHLDLTTRMFADRTGRQPAWRWHVPGRIEIFGKHTDYAGGASLVATVPRGFTVVAAPRDDRRVRVIDARHEVETVVDVDDPTPCRGWANYATVTAHRLAMNFPGVELGADIALASDLPRAAGVSSSSALVVGLATALLRRSGVDRTPVWSAEVTSLEDLAWYLGCVENGLTYKSLAGTAGVGTQGGSQDHTAILGCRAGHVSHFAFIPVTRHADIPMPDDWMFVVLSSGVHADKAGSVRDRYNRGAVSVQALLRLWRDATGQAQPSLAAVLTGNAEAEARLRALARTQAVEGFSAEDLERRLTQLIGELTRVPAAATAFADADRAGVGALALASQHDAEALLGNQIPETMALARLARENGAFAASAFGAGFGGSVWALVDRNEADAFGARWLEAYQRACHPTGQVEWFTCRPGNGVVEI
jgi:galactokinase